MIPKLLLNTRMKNVYENIKEYNPEKNVKH